VCRVGTASPGQLTTCATVCLTSSLTACSFDKLKVPTLLTFPAATQSGVQSLPPADDDSLLVLGAGARAVRSMRAGAACLNVKPPTR
jgi:hypothetical protein